MSLPLREFIQTFVSRLSSAMGIPFDVEVGDADERNNVIVHIRTEEDAHILIGKNGQNLGALEQLIRAACYRQVGADRRIVVDVNDYRKTRSDQLVTMVRQVVSRVRDTQNSQALLPMVPYERRIIHTELASYTDVTSESIGDEPHRRVVIKPLAL